MSYFLDVATNGQPVGQIQFDAKADNYGFRYAEQWRTRRGAYYLAPPIPLTGEEAPPGTMHRFLDNLLPEGRALDIAALHNQISKSNTFALIRLLGKEPVGALSFLAADGAVDEIEPAIPRRRIITNEELDQRIHERDAVPFPVWDGKVRLSLAGYQDKLQVLVEGDQLSLADGSLSSTHLLKPESQNPNTPHMVANEHYCMTLAAHLGLSVAPVSIRRLPKPILLIERFDRVVEWEQATLQAKSVRRLHVIDACQALDLPSSFKYERNFGTGADVRDIREGASFERIFSLTREMLTPATARPFLLQWAILHLLIGNSDAHGKNLSFFVNAAGLAPAPMYDLVSVAVYGDRIENELAMGYGDVFRLDELTPFCLADFAHRTGTLPAQLTRTINAMAKRILDIAPTLAKSDIYIGDERDFVRQIAEFASAQAKRLMQIAAGAREVDRKLFN